MNKQIILKITNNIEIIGSDRMSEPFVRELLDDLIMENPKYKSAVDHGYSTHGIPSTLHFIKRNVNGNWTLPRGYRSKLQGIIAKHRTPYRVLDKTMIRDEVNFVFSGALRKDQPKAASAVLGHQYSVLQRPTGGGKTIIALFVVAKRRQPTLIVVHTKELMDQWLERAMEFLSLKEKEIGLFGGGHRTIGSGKLIISIINSLYNNIDIIKPVIGQVIVDECHRVPARTFSEGISNFDCKFFLALSATPFRKDGLTKVINFYLGAVVYRTDIKKLIETKQVMKASLIVIKTNFNYFMKGTKGYPQMYKALIEDKDRNELIIKTVIRNNKKNPKEVSLIISDRKEHCKMFYERLEEMGVRVGMLIGGTKKENRKEIKKRLDDGCYDIFISTCQLIGEGFDSPRLGLLYLTTPISDEKRIIQYVGRVIRILEGKKNAIIIDFFDPQWLLQISFRKRMNTYGQLGIRPKHLPEGVIWPKKLPTTMVAGSVWARQVSTYIDWLRKQK